MYQLTITLITLLFIIICVCINGCNEAINDHGSNAQAGYQFIHYATIVLPVIASIACLVAVVIA